MITYLQGIILSLTLMILVTGTVFAHESGPQYIKVNSEFVSGNPILDITEPTAFLVGADIASSSGYLVGEEVVFAIDERLFPNPYAQGQNLSPPEPYFRWDFKDGSTPVEGSRVSHVFTKAGTYVVELAAKFEGKSDEYATINTVQVNVHPVRGYKPPIPTIIVNGQILEDARRDTFTIKPATPVSFEATPADPAFSYQWDFGDGEGAEGKTVTHRYGRDEYFPVVVLRVIDQHNITADTFALLDLPFEKPNFFLKIWYAFTDFLQGL